MKYQVIIIGGGPAGYTAAEAAGKAGLSVLLFEKQNLGGVCLNEGCIPTKTLLYSAKTYDGVRHASKYAVNVPEVSFDLAKIIARKSKVVRKLVLGVKGKLTSNNVTVVNGEAYIIDKNTVRCGEDSYECENLIICTGSETFIPPFAGIDTVDYWTHRDALDNKELPASLAIVGGGVIGMEFASFFSSLGVQVTVVEMLDEILNGMDKELSALLRAEYAKRGVTFYLNTKVVEVNAHGVVIEKEGKVSTIEAEKILLSVGRKANLSRVGLDKLNIELHRNGVKVDEHLLTSHPRVYACGDITGYSLLAHTAIREAEVAINHILGVEDRMNYDCVPGVVYTNPEVAGVGKTEEELIKSGLSYRVSKLPMAYSGRFVAENEQGNGLCKLIQDEEGKIIGCHMLGNPASELIVIAGIAIQRGYTVEEFQKTVFPHPTVGEIYHEIMF